MSKNVEKDFLDKRLSERVKEYRYKYTRIIKKRSYCFT